MILSYIAGSFLAELNAIKIFAIILLFSSACAFLVINYRFLVNIKNLHRKSILARSLMSILSEADEIIIIDDNLTVIYAKHLAKEFLNKRFSFDEIMRREFTEDDGNMDKCSYAISKNLYFENVFKTAKTNDLEQERHIWVRVLPLYTNAVPKYRALILSDITIHATTEKNSSKPDKNFEQYIENAPFGLIYTNSVGEILGANKTFKSWIFSYCDRLLGENITNVTSITPEELNAILNSKVQRKTILRQNRFDQINAILFSKKVSDDYYILVFFKLQNDQLKDVECSMTEQLPIPAMILNEASDILEKNKPFEDMLNEYAKKASSKEVFKVGNNILDYVNEASYKQLFSVKETLDDRAGCFEMGLKNIEVSVMTYIKKIESSKYLIQMINTSEQKKLEQQFAQAQKMQAIGQLAGGIAHDFNNLLTAMIGFCDLLLQRVMPNDPSYADIMQIKQNANRAANLVRQLLAFSRRQVLQPRRINISDVLYETSALLRRLIGSKINFKVKNEKNLWDVKVDVSQLEQVIMNIVVNARDAMKNGGDLIIETKNYTNNSQKQIGGDVIPAGDYVLIKISDTGSGIKPEILHSIFEPFFSTKGIGEGTGLGLPTAYGIIKQTGGGIDVESVVDKGTTFSLFLPRCNDTEIHTKIKPANITDITGTETILLVEDEDAVRIFAARALRDKGYRVIEAENGEIALKLLKEGNKPDVLITDISMPKMDGTTLANKAKELIPGLLVIFTSGYTEETFRRDLSNDSSIHFLSKPFTLRDLAAKVREVVQNKSILIG